MTIWGMSGITSRPYLLASMICAVKQNEVRMKEQWLNRLGISTVIGLVSTWLFGLVGFTTWLIDIMITGHIKK